MRLRTSAEGSRASSSRFAHSPRPTAAARTRTSARRPKERDTIEAGWPDLVFAFVAPIGVDLSVAEMAIQNALSTVSYYPICISLMDDLLQSYPGPLQRHRESAAERAHAKMTAGNKFRVLT